MTSVYEAWNDVMRDVQAISKDSRNTQQGFNFRGVDAVMNAVGPALREHGVTVVPTSVESKHRDFNTKSGTLMHEAIVTVGYAIIGPDGGIIPGAAIGEAADAGDKATPKAMSVAYRTFLLQALTIPTDEPDPDEHVTDRTETPIVNEWGSSEVQETAFTGLRDRSGALADSDGKTALKAWVKENRITAKSITKDQAREWSEKLTTLEAEEPFTEPEDKSGGWKSAAERNKMRASLMERLGELPAYESEIVNGEMERIGIPATGAWAKVTKAQAEEFLAAIKEAEDLAKESGS